MGSLQAKSESAPDNVEKHSTSARKPNSGHNAAISDSHRPPINWVITMFLVGVPLAAIVSLLWVPIQRKTLAFACFYAPFRALTVTTGEIAPASTEVENSLSLVDTDKSKQGIIDYGLIDHLQPVRP